MISFNGFPLRRLLVIPVLSLAVSCSGAATKPFSLLGQWKAIKGECGTYCTFYIADRIERDRPDHLYIIFPEATKPGASAYPFKHVKKEEWQIEFPGGAGYLYLEGKRLVSRADITYEKIAELPSASEK